MNEIQTRESRPWLGTGLAVAAGSYGLAGLAIRLTVRDSLTATAMIYYATPWPVLATMLVLVAGGLRLRNRWGWACPLATIGLVGLTAWMITALSETAPQASPEQHNTLTCLTWNISHGQAGWHQLARSIRDEAADLVCLVEAGPNEPENDRFWNSALPDYSSAGLGSGMLVLVKNGTIRQTRSGSLDGTARFRQFDVSCRDSQLVLLIVDIKSTPWISRQAALKQLAHIVDNIPDRPVLLTGDFNTPTDSAWFDTWHSNLKNAWDEAGTGFRPTWPVPLPLLDLDQCWGNKLVRFVNCRAATSSQSDHRKLLTRFAVHRTGRNYTSPSRLRKNHSNDTNATNTPSTYQLSHRSMTVARAIPVAAG